VEEQERHTRVVRQILGILVALKVRQPASAGHDHDHEWTVYHALTVRDQRCIRLRVHALCRSIAATTLRRA